MDVEVVAGAVVDVDEAVRVVAPVGHVPLLHVAAVRGEHAGARLVRVGLGLDAADAELPVDGRLGGADLVAPGLVVDGLLTQCSVSVPPCWTRILFPLSSSLSADPDTQEAWEIVESSPKLWPCDEGEGGEGQARDLQTESTGSCRRRTRKRRPCRQSAACRQNSSCRSRRPGPR